MQGGAGSNKPVPYGPNRNSGWSVIYKFLKTDLPASGYISLSMELTGSYRHAIFPKQCEPASTPAKPYQ
jgi:hypothetical protein